MQSSLKKSLYLGLAALSFAGVAAVSTTASAKSYATAGAYSTLKTDATKRNVEATGTNALYTKPGTVKGAKVVASKATMAKLASSKKSADYFRAYGVKTTNRGSVYYRVVSMDGKYRGYVYGGKSDTAFAGGIKSVDTLTDATKPAKTTGYYLKDVSKNTIWTAPKYTQYKASKVNLYGAVKNDSFTVDKAATKTAEGSLYYHVTDDNDASISGWIYAGKGYDASITDSTKQDLGGLQLGKPSATATANNSVTVNYVDVATNASVAKKTFVNESNKDSKENTAVNSDKDVNGDTLAQFYAKTANVPAGYKIDSSATTPADPATALYGGTLTVPVYKTATSKIAFQVSGVAAANASDTDSAKLAVTAAAPVAGSTFTFQAPAMSTSDLDAALTGKTTDKVDATKLNTLLSGDKLGTVQGTTTLKDSKGAEYHLTYTYNPTATAGLNSNVTFGNTVRAAYDVTYTAGVAPSQNNTTNSTSSDYVAK